MKKKLRFQKNWFRLLKENKSLCWRKNCCTWIKILINRLKVRIIGELFKYWGRDVKFFLIIKKTKAI
jgi:hypothetical protein